MLRFIAIWVVNNRSTQTRKPSQESLRFEKFSFWNNDAWGAIKILQSLKCMRLLVKVFPIAPKFGKHLGSSAAEMPAKFQSNTSISSPHLVPSRLCAILWEEVQCDIEAAPRWRMYVHQWSELSSAQGLFSTKPLPNPMLADCLQGPVSI